MNKKNHTSNILSQQIVYYNIRSYVLRNHLYTLDFLIKEAELFLSCTTAKTV